MADVEGEGGRRSCRPIRCCDVREGTYTRHQRPAAIPQRKYLTLITSFKPGVPKLLMCRSGGMSDIGCEIVPLPEVTATARRDAANVVLNIFGDRAEIALEEGEYCSVGSNDNNSGLYVFNSEDRVAESRTSLGGSFVPHKSGFCISLCSAIAEWKGAFWWMWIGGISRTVGCCSLGYDCPRPDVALCVSESTRSENG